MGEKWWLVSSTNSFKPTKNFDEDAHHQTNAYNLLLTKASNVLIEASQDIHGDVMQNLVAIITGNRKAYETRIVYLFHNSQAYSDV